MAYDFSKFTRQKFTITEALSQEGIRALLELDRRTLATTSAAGDVVGPASAVNGEVVLFNGATGKLIKSAGQPFTPAGIGAVPTTRTVNGHALSANVTVTAADVGADATGTAAGLIAAHNAAADPHTQYALDTDLAGYVPTTRTVNGHDLSANVTVTATDVGLGSVTNDAQTKAAIVPNTAPSSGQILVGNAGGTAYAPVGMSGDAALTSAGALTIAAGAVTLAKQANLAANSIVGNNTGAPATPLALTVAQVKTLLSYTASDVGLGSVTNDAQTKAAIVPNTVPAAGNLLVGNAGGTAYASVASSGDVTVSSAGAFTIGNAKVTYAKMQNVSATSRILGRVTAGAGSPEELTLTQALDFVGSAANGDILTRQAGTWNRLAIGSAGQKLVVSSSLPAWTNDEQMLANVTLGVAGTSLSSGTFSACKFLRVEIYISGYAGSDTASLQFNATAGTGYRYRWWTMAAGGVVLAPGLTAASTDRIKVGAANTTNSRRITCEISNDSSNTEKLVKFLGSVFGTGSAATQATEDGGNGAWISGASTQITRIDLISSSNMNAGTQMTIFGWN